MDNRTLTLLALLLLATPARGQEPAAELARQAQGVLKQHCHRCHGAEGSAKGGLDYILLRDKLVARNKLVPGSATESEVYQRVRDGDMPPRDQKARPTKDDIALLQRWIDAGAPAERTATGPRRFVSEIEVVRTIRADLEAVPAKQRRFARYFTLTHLANAGRADDDLEADRRALAKLVNALSWHPRITRPVAIDAGQTVFRVDLRDYRWNSRLWDRLIAQYPYRLTHTSPEAKDNAAMTGTELPHLRADWFVATASRAPLYYDVLQTPASDKALERLLSVDVPLDIQEETVVRAGFNGSGVSRNNRVLERHDAAYGAYWRTYDFSDNVDKQNIFDRPLGPPPAQNSFVPAGGEAIFHLPNGLHGYLLVDANGQRVDKAPVEIVSDPQRPDRAVEAGLSCMSCHAQGFLPKADQVRAHVLKNAKAFPAEIVDGVKALYPPETRFKALLDQDNERYQKSLAKTGVRVNDAEPITAVTLRYEGVVDLSSAATEAGLKAEEFLARLSKSPTLGRSLGALQVKGGTVQRQTFQTAFLELAREFRLGDDADPKAAPSTVVERPFVGHTAAVLCIAFADDGRYAVSGSEDRTIRLWDVKTGKELRRFEGHTGGVTALAFVQEKQLLSAGRDRTLRLWELETGKEVRRLEGHTDQVTCLDATSDYRAIGGLDRTVRLWDLRTGKETQSFAGHTDRVNSVSFHIYGERFVSAGQDGTIRVWNIREAKETGRLEGHAGLVQSVYWKTSRASIVVSGGNDRTVRVWDVKQLRELRRLEGHANAVIHVQLADAGRRVLSGSSQYQQTDQVLRHWNADDGKPLGTWGGRDEDRVSSLAFSPDGKQALTTGPDQTLRLWKLE